MVGVEELAEAFPEVELETLGRIHDMLDAPTMVDVAETLEAAKQRGKVPDADYTSRIKGASEPRLHPDFKEELEREGLDPDEAERGLQAEQEVQQQNWEERAKRVADGGRLWALVTLYIDLQEKTTEVLKSPTRQNIPEDMEIASSILSNELQARISRIGESGDTDRLTHARKQIQRLPEGEFKDAYLEMVRGWLHLADNEGTEFEEARQWVLDPDDPQDVADRLQTLKRGRQFDVTTDQALQIAEQAKDRFGV